jgi:NADPH:quinone reductase-like Zn-dependent oxidoreductase
MQDFVPLKEGDWLVQNGANSAVGLAVIQLAKVKHQIRKDHSTPPVDLTINILMSF